MRRLLNPILALVLIAAACGGGSSDPPRTSVERQPESAEGFVVDPEIDRITTKLVEDLGEEPAAIALITAWELGYSPDQILSLGDATQLAVSGELVLNGVVLEPEGQRRGVIDLTPVSNLLGDRPPDPLGVMKGVGDCPDMTTYLFIKLILVSARAGLDPGAIMTAVALGICPVYKSLSIEDDEGDVVAECDYLLIVDQALEYFNNPASCSAEIRRRERSEATTTTSAPVEAATTTQPPESVVAVYHGVAVIDLLATHPQRDVTNTCQTALEADLLLSADGTLSFEVTWTEWIWNAGEEQTGCRPYADLPIAEKRTPTDKYTSLREGTWTEDGFTASIEDPIHATSSSAPAFSGYFDGNLAVLDAITLPYEGVGLTYTTVTVSFALQRVDG